MMSSTPPRTLLEVALQRVLASLGSCWGEGLQGHAYTISDPVHPVGAGLRKLDCLVLHKLDRTPDAPPETAHLLLHQPTGLDLLVVEVVAEVAGAMPLKPAGGGSKERCVLCACSVEVKKSDINQEDVMSGLGLMLSR